jgi:hypothetical protein
VCLQKKEVMFQVEHVASSRRSFKEMFFFQNVPLCEKLVERRGIEFHEHCIFLDKWNSWELIFEICLSQRPNVKKSSVHRANMHITVLHDSIIYFLAHTQSGTAVAYENVMFFF